MSSPASATASEKSETNFEFDPGFEPPAPGQVTALLDRGCAFEGNLTFEGTVRIGGRFKGEIFTKDTLVIDAGADVEAHIEANVVIISGVVRGNVFARRKVLMHPPGVLKGTITTPSLRIDEGVVFEGASYMPKVGPRRS